VIVDNFVQAMAYVWGESGTDRTPLFARWASNILSTLYEKKLTLLEAEYLIDRTNRRVRHEITKDISNYLVRQDWAFTDTLTPKDYDAQISSTVNRLRVFLNKQQTRRVFGQNGASLDLGKALEDGSIILVNLSTEKTQVSNEDASLLATLLLSDLWKAAEERGKKTSASQIKPFYVYIDEFQNFVTPTIAKNLDQARGFGLHLTLANQFPRQILHTGAQGEQVYDSVMANARSKIVFETRGEENLRPLAFDLFTGVLNPDEIKHTLYSTKVMEFREEMRVSYSSGSAASTGTGIFTGGTASRGAGGFASAGTEYDASAWNEAMADSSGDSSTSTNSQSESQTRMPVLVPVIGKEISHVQFRTLEEQIFRAMAVLFDQQQRQAVARLAGMRAPASIWTPFVAEPPTTVQMEKLFLRGCYKKLKFATPTEKVDRELVERKKKFTGIAENKETGEATAVKRRVKKNKAANVAG
jgi:hypothetical protein